MSSTSTQFRLLVAGAAVLCLAACGSAPLEIVVDPALAGAEVHHVEGLRSRTWGKPIQFGPFSTRKTRVGSTWTWTAGSFDLAAGQKVRPYRFVFAGERGEEWQVECRAKTPILRHADEHSTWTFPVGETTLGCAMRGADGTVQVLQLAGNAFAMRGTAVFGDQAIEVRELHGVSDGSGNAHSLPFILGYELRQGGHVLGAVDLQSQRVILASDVPAALRNPVAMISSVLLFFNLS